VSEHDVDCYSCGEIPPGDCAKSKRECGHHCNCSWIHDGCCWCGAEFGEDDGGTSGKEGER